MGSEDLLRSHGVEVVVLDDDRCKELMGRFIQEKPEVREGIGVAIWCVDLRLG